ncbi:MAG: hypothetical protein ACOX3Q_07665 [Clostridia bacterium]|jgi:hypothetical protein
MSVKHDRENKKGNKQDKLKNATESIPSGQQNQGHNARKESLGPNGKR